MIRRSAVIGLLLVGLTVGTYKSATFLAQTSSDGQDVCYVDTPTSVTWIRPGGGRIQCGLACIRRHLCWAFNFHSLLGKCEHYEKIPSNVDTIPGCKAFFYEGCSEAKGVCSPHANCSQDGDDLICSCLPGFFENGRQCSDIDECAANNGGCTQYGSCTNTIGSYFCTCHNGSSGSSFECINPCLVEATSWGKVSTAPQPTGNITLAGISVINTRYGSSNPYRGFHIIELVVDKCSVSTYHHFDTNTFLSWGSRDLANYINGLPSSTVLVGVTAADAQYWLFDDAKNALLALGVDVRGLPFLGKASFVAQVGRPSASLTKLMTTPPNDVMKLTAIVSKQPGTTELEILLIN